MYKIFYYLQRVYQKFHLNNLLPFAVLISYTLIGAAIFRKLELERDLHERELFRRSYYYAFDQITKRILELRCDDYVIKDDKSLQMKYAKEAVNWFLDYTNLTDVIRERNASSPWSWYGSMFYAGQLYTTIGYGLPAAKTLAGQIASIFYIMFGIPIFLIILKDVGRLLSRSFRKFYKRSRSTGKKTLYNPTNLQSTTQSLNSLSVKEVDLDPEGGTLTEQSTTKFTHENAFSIPIALALLILWIGFSAALFCLYEPEWGYLTSVYFFFVSISTVGLGDIVPGNKDMMLGYFLLILVGLALLSMCINLIQEYIDEIERVAAIAKNETDFECHASPFEVGMASGLLTVPLDKQYKSMRSLPNRVKEWIAERIANNMIESQLAEMNYDMESEAEMSVPFQNHSQERQQQCESRINPEEMQCFKPPLRGADFIDYLWKHIAAIRTVQALEKAKFYTPNDDFQSMLFSKFVRNSKLERFMDQVYEAAPRTHHSATQTDMIHTANIVTFDKDMNFLPGSRDSSSIQSDIIHQSTNSFSNIFDGENMLSSAFVTDESDSICSSISSGHITQLSFKKPFDSSLKWKSEWKEIPRSLRARSCCDTISYHLRESTTASLLPSLSNTQLSQNRSYYEIGSLPPSFHQSSLQSIPSLFSRKCGDEL
ncbi:BMA-TWK-12 [Dirofilaria immitis]|nr:BMA-TWK-12 [Dirofilaria immitis]